MQLNTSIPIFSSANESDLADEEKAFYKGLLQPQATVSPKYFYSALGSRLFDAITLLPEYYPCRTEKSIFDSYKNDLIARLPQASLFIDLGAGDCAKASSLLSWFNPTAYLAVDISVDYLTRALRVVNQDHPNVAVAGLGCDFSNQLILPSQVSHWLDLLQAQSLPRIVFYPGSSIGNFSPGDALRLLQQIHAMCAQAGGGGGLLIGVDQVKDLSVLEPAYDDALGVTAAFNKSLLLHANERFETNFNIQSWSHKAFFNTPESRIEMHLQSSQDQSVCWNGGERFFKSGETIHTENSYKWMPGDFQALLEAAGFHGIKHFKDTNNWFSVFWAQA